MVMVCINGQCSSRCGILCLVVDLAEIPNLVKTEEMPPDAIRSNHQSLMSSLNMIQNDGCVSSQACHSLRKHPWRVDDKITIELYVIGMRLELR